MTKLRAAMREAVKAPEVIRTFENAGSPVAYLDAPEFRNSSKPTAPA